ncbi:MAG: hypothetical protein R2712_14190 [Vicinamibacterales bacterium]
MLLAAVGFGLVLAAGGARASGGDAVAPAQPAAAGRWFKGNLHTHTLNSDGDSTPDEVVRWVPRARA